MKTKIKNFTIENYQHNDQFEKHSDLNFQNKMQLIYLHGQYKLYKFLDEIYIKKIKDFFIKKKSYSIQ